MPENQRLNSTTITLECPVCEDAFDPGKSTLADTFHSDGSIHYIIDCGGCELPFELVLFYDTPLDGLHVEFKLAVLDLVARAR